jgi:uncharacterized repeat protein (TIGR02543 family)
MKNEEYDDEFFLEKTSYSLFQLWDLYKAGTVIYTIKYDLNGGMGTKPEDHTVFKGNSIVVANSDGISKAPYNFISWNTDRSGNGTPFNASAPWMPYGNWTLYAQWKSECDSFGHFWDNWRIYTTPTCAMTGVERRVCKRDSSHIDTRTIGINPSAHKWGSWVTTRHPTCSDVGVEQRTCQNNSGHKETRNLGKNSTAHRWGPWVTTRHPTCSDVGVEQRTCQNNSGHKETRNFGKNSTAHKWGPWVVTVQPTATKNGTEQRTCQYNPSHKETRTIFATGEKSLGKINPRLSPY